MRRMISLCLAVLLILSLTACGGTAPVSSDLPDVPNESDEFVPDTTTTLPPTTTTTTTVPPTTTIHPDDEEKEYCTATLEDDFEEGVVLVTLKKSATEINRIIPPSFFEPYLDDSEIVSVKDLTRIDNDAAMEWIDKDNYHQILKIQIHAKGKAAVLAAVKKLEQHPAVKSAEPNCIHTLLW